MKREEVKKMNKLIYALPLMLMLVASVSAYTIDSWSVRGDVNKNYYIGQPFFMSFGSFNANFAHRDDGYMGSGYIFVQGKLADDSNTRLSVHWAATGNEYGFNVLQDNPCYTLIKANARVIKNGQITMGVPVYIYYYKHVKTIYVSGPNFYLSGTAA
jgi:hypothetical protein